MNIALLSNIITSFFLTYLSIPTIVKVSNAKNLMDVPDHRKLNKTVVPTLGGIAIFIGLTLSSMLFLPEKTLPGLRFLFVGITMMFFIGLKDDILIIAARKKLIVQIVAALILVVMGNFQIHHFYGILDTYYINNWISIPLTTVIVVYLINAMNLIDGIDGLAGSIGLLVSASLGTWFYVAGFIAYGIICTAMAGSLLAYLRYNLWGGKNKVFMGDTGSLILGIFLAAMTIKFNELNIKAPVAMQIKQAPIIALALLIVPITDTLRVFTIRIIQKRSPFSPDMNHIHHLLIKSGLTHIQATSFLVAYTVLFLLIGLTLQNYLNVTANFLLMLVLSFAMVGYLKKRYTEDNQSLKIDESGVKIIKLYASKDGNFFQNFIRDRRKIL
ncbi:MAG TPA: MraY family glycosyltransferase [Sunxiuqinia sp.]|nr:MraY family glycosyltransferase [Sunxiuqinia sp.]